MEDIPFLVKDLGLILFVAGLVTLIFKRLKQPLVLGYIVAGFLVSPSMPYTESVIDKENIEVWANIGVIFLLFSLGLEFSFKKITKMGAAPMIAAVLIVFCMMLLGNCVGHLFGWSDMDCIFLGGMLAMSSTTIIYKAFDDMGLRQQKFASLVMSVLILEDILAIVLMVMLSAFAKGGGLNGSDMVMSILRIAFYVLLWFILGIFIIPLFLRKTRKLMNEETLLIVSLALCFGMALLAAEAGFSSAFGAFIMGSILAETIEVEKIEKVVNPVKNLFGAVFFVSVGMLVQPQILTEYAFPILCLVLAIIVGHAIFSSIAYFISGQPLSNALKCGFSMAQIGEFAFIIASLGLSLKVISPYLYPVVVAVSVITTFLTPYMIKFSTTVYEHIEHRLPQKWMDVLNTLTIGDPNAEKKDSIWRRFLMALLKQIIIYSVICIAIILLCVNFLKPIIASWLPGEWATAISVVITLALMSPFLRAIAMKKLRSNDFMTLWDGHRLNRLPLIFVIIMRILITLLFVYNVVSIYSDKFGYGILVAVAVLVVFIIISSRSLRDRGMNIEKLFMQNLNARENRQVDANKRTKRNFNDERLIDRDIHIADFLVPEDSAWTGMSLHDLHFGSTYGIHVSAIKRGSYNINIPGGTHHLYPGDILQVVGSDKELAIFNKVITSNILTDGIKNKQLLLRQIELTDNCPFVGKNIAQSGIRDKYHCMAVGLENGDDNLQTIDNTIIFHSGDLLWLVGEQQNIEQILHDNC